MFDQLMDHCPLHNLLPDFHSAYQKNYSTETSLLSITNDILWGMENQEITTMLILDLLAAFDTMDHDILLISLILYHAKWQPEILLLAISY